MSLLLTLTALLATTAAAQSGSMSLCTGSDCASCPNSITTDGTGYPACVVYDRDTVMGGQVDSYEAVEGQDAKVVYFDIAEQTDSTCRTIIRSPASTDDENCGYPVYAGRGGVCYKGEVKATFMTQFCCGTGDCGSAGAKRSDTANGGVSSSVLLDINGNVVVPHSVGHHSVGDMLDTFLEDFGINASSLLARESASAPAPVFKIGYEEKATASVEKRDCDSYTADGAPYTKTGDSSVTVSGYICGDTSKVTITNENSVAHTTSFSASVGDPFGIVSASIDFSTEESASQSWSYEFTPEAGQCGHVAWTAFYTCTKGTITGCDEGDQTGEVCTAKRLSDKQIDGAYHFVQTG